MKAMVLGVAAGLAVAAAANAPAEAQFMSSPYPVIIVPPPPAHNLYLPKPVYKPAQPAKPAALPPAASAPGEVQCRYQGQTRVCD